MCQSKVDDYKLHLKNSSTSHGTYFVYDTSPIKINDMLPNMKYRRAADINKLNVDLYMYQYMKFGTEK